MSIGVFGGPYGTGGWNAAQTIEALSRNLRQLVVNEMGT